MGSGNCKGSNKNGTPTEPIGETMSKRCLLYILAKAKSLKAGTVSFRGIFASPMPILNCQVLRVGAKAFTCMLRMLQ